MSLVTVLFFETSVPLGLFFDFHFTGSQSQIGKIPNFPSHQEFTDGLKHSLTTVQGNITFVM